MDRNLNSTKVRRQGNSLVLLVPKSFNISNGTKMIPKLTDKGIFYEFAQDDFWDFDEQILEDVISQGYEGKDLLKKFKEMKSNIPHAIDEIASNIDRDEKPISRKDLEKEIGL